MSNGNCKIGAAATALFLSLLTHTGVLAETDVPLPPSKAEALLLNKPIDLNAGAKAFQGCIGCHSIGPDARDGVGPHLNGIIGRAAASSESYDYSAALKNAGKKGLIWSPYKIDAYIARPGEFLPGNKMAHIGVQDEDQRRNLIGYLKTFP